MRKEFSLSNNKAMMNFTVKYCNTMEKILDSSGFNRVLESYLNKIKSRKSNIYIYINKELNGEDINSKEITNLFKLLIVMNNEDVMTLNHKYKFLLENRERFIDFIEGLYGYWRKLERYSLIQSSAIKEGMASVNFIESNEKLKNLILGLYRKIEENILGHKPKIYRQLSVGSNAGIILSNIKWYCPEEYEILRGIPFIDSIILQSPYITYPKKNTRDGIFTESYSNLLEESIIKKDHFFCYPIKVGELLAYVFFHRDFMAHGIALCNLFEIAVEEECVNKKPDIIYALGARHESKSVITKFYDDSKNDIMMGYVSYGEEIDYFGYMKKMILTLHNLIMIKRGFLPIHGAMVNITLKNGKNANVIIMGDSGAGKSESLEALRTLGADHISDMNIIFDDMGTIKIDDKGNVIGYGTEIGAFVRLDDLDQGYAFKEIDRSIFMNPDKINARLVMPINTYKEIVKGYKVDLFLYANNYDEVKEGESYITFFSDINKAIKVFKDGARMAKGTTTEKGLVKSYFANPFGPVQKQEEVDVIIEKYFKAMMDSEVKMGDIKTSLGIKGMEKKGPKNAAIELLNIIKTL
ncbi:phosphoenolpyruvate carboxykinase [Clostridium sp.]|uniref:phosphoenolpyruvate carboxykinase n=1 Tax=Clostridium sp. TaxID=1506 RepID=UPI003464C6D0